MGRVGRAHGVRGELKAIPETDDPQRFSLVDRLFVGPSEADVAEREVEGVRFQYPKGRTVVLLSLAGVETPEAVEELRGMSLYAHADDLPPLDEGEVFLHDLIGLEVVAVDEAGEPMGDPIGTVRDLFDAAQLLFSIERPDGSTVLLPDVEEFVDRVDVAAGRLYVRPPEGLIE